MALTPLGRAALVAREALKTRAYKDSVGVLTIGVGHTSMAGPPAVTAGMTITRGEALSIFDRDLRQYEAAVDGAVTVPLADHERDALVSVCYNIGPKGFRKSTFVKRLNAGDREGCAGAIMAWTKPEEITSRRAAERDQFLTPYEIAAPKARNTDARSVKGERAASRPAPTRTAPQPIPAPPAPAASVVPARKPGVFGGLFARVLGRADAAAPVATPLPAELTRGDPAVFRVQRALADRGYAEVGEIDGVIGGAGSKTRAAIRAAQAESGLAITGEMDAAFLAALPTMPARAIPPARAGATVQDLRAAGSTPVAAADGLGMLGRILLGGGALGGLDASGALTKVKDTADQATAAVQSIQGVINAGIGGVQWIATHWWLVAVPVGLWAALSATKRLLEIRALYRQGAITRAGA